MEEVIETQSQGEQAVNSTPLSLKSLDSRIAALEAKVNSVSEVPEATEDPIGPTLEERFNTLVERLQSRVHGVGAV